MKLRRFLRKFRYNPKRSFVFMFLFLSLVSLTVGYAFLTTTMSIDGVSKMLEARWDIHFENLEVTTGSVTATTDATITTPTSVTFAAQLENPGDFYEFTVDVVNEGTINAMIDSVNVLPVLTTEQQEYLEYVVTYINGVELAPRQRLDVNDSERILVRFLYKDGVDESVYPTEDQELTIQFEVVYIQADGTEEDVAACSSVVCEEGTYLPAGTCDCVPCEAGSSCPGGTYNYDPIETHGRSNCPKGSYSLSESDTCTLCPAGTYQDEEGQIACKVCATGKTSTAGTTTSCTTNCEGYSGTSSWATPSWNNNTVSNVCTATACTTGYSLASDNICRQPYTVNFNYNKATWNTSNVTRTCTPGANGKCSVTAPGINNLSGTNKNGQAFSNYFSIKGWNTNSSATTATYGATASIEVSGNTTYYAIVTLAKTSYWMYADALLARVGAGSNYTSTGQFEIYVNRTTSYLTVDDFQYVANEGTNYLLWLHIIAMNDNFRCESGFGVSCPSSGCVCLNRWSSAYYLIYP